MVTSSCCDLVVIDSSTTPATVYLFELTICFERQENIFAANMLLYNRYASLSADIQEAGYSCKNIPFEVVSGFTWAFDPWKQVKTFDLTQVMEAQNYLQTILEKYY